MGALHNFTKPRVPWKADGVVSFAGVAPSVATMQDVVNAQAKGWEALWNTRKGSSAPDLSSHLDNEPPLRRLSAAQIRGAAGNFKAATGVGGDNVHPRWFAHLSDKSLDRIAFSFFCMEELGLVPSQLVNVLLLYAKPLGGFRPIGLLPSFMRLWEYCRKQTSWDW